MNLHRFLYIKKGLDSNAREEIKKKKKILLRGEKPPIYLYLLIIKKKTQCLIADKIMVALKSCTKSYHVFWLWSGRN